jgi:hypothetical protein
MLKQMPPNLLLGGFFVHHFKPSPCLMKQFALYATIAIRELGSDDR